jgi:hypothetical protein
VTVTVSLRFTCCVASAESGNSSSCTPSAESPTALAPKMKVSRYASPCGVQGETCVTQSDQPWLPAQQCML